MKESSLKAISKSVEEINKVFSEDDLFDGTKASFGYLAFKCLKKLEKALVKCAIIAAEKCVSDKKQEEEAPPKEEPKKEAQEAKKEEKSKKPKTSTKKGPKVVRKGAK